MSRTTSIRLVAGLVALTLIQVAIQATQTPLTCTICNGPSTPQAGQQAESCNGTGQLDVFDGRNPSGHVYKPSSTGNLECSSPIPGSSGSHPCTDLRTGCCPSGDAGFFMCNIVVQPDCSFISQCASVCCPAGSQDVNEVVQPGCSMRSKFLVCTAGSNNAP